MQKFFKISLRIIISILFVFLFLYGLFLYVLPVIANSEKVKLYIEKSVFNNTGYNLKTEGMKVKTYPNLSMSFVSKEISLSDDEKILDAQNIDIKLFPLKKHINNIYVDYIYIDKSGLTNIFKKKDNKRKSKFKLTSLPEINIKKTEIYIVDDTNNNSLITISDLLSANNTIDGKIYNAVSFDSKIVSTYLKNDIRINNKNNILFNDSSINFNNLKIDAGNSSLYVNGSIVPENKEYTLKLTGNDIPVCDVEGSLLYFLKLKKPGKNFLENFVDFSGSLDLNLDIKNNGIYGKSIINNLGAKTVMFNIPVKLDDFTVYFDGDEINTSAYGILGNEKVYADFKLRKFDALERTIWGSVHSVLTDAFVQKYMPELSIQGAVDATLRYYIKNSKPEITYLLKIPEGSNLYYKNASLGLIDKNRRVFARTLKKGSKLFINRYDYATQDGNKVDVIVEGTGLFDKINGKMQPVYITCRTVEPAPVSVTGSFGKKLDGGTFNGNLKYDFYKNLLTGNFVLNNSKFKDFYIEQAAINADSKKMNISANGTYLDSVYTSKVEMNNKFEDVITINNIELFLDKYVVKKSNNKIKKKPNINKKILDKAQQTDFIIENGSVKINKIIYKKILVENIAMFISLRDNIAKFHTSEALFAKGFLKARGTYDIDEKISIIDFEARNIDSDSVATMIFNLPGQIEGTSNAKLHAKIPNDLHNVQANAQFCVKEGFLPHLGSTEFIIKRSNKNKKPLKIRLSDIINIDISKSKAMASDLNGSFDLFDYELQNVEIFSQQKYLSLFINGDYNLDSEDAKLQMWGKYNKTAQRRVKILFIPLSVIMKFVFKPESTKHLYKKELDKVPCIQAAPDETEAFTVRVNGNLNKNDVKVELKSLQ